MLHWVEFTNLPALAWRNPLSRRFLDWDYAIFSLSLSFLILTTIIWYLCHVGDRRHLLIYHLHIFSCMLRDSLIHFLVRQLVSLSITKLLHRHFSCVFTFLNIREHMNTERWRLLIQRSFENFCQCLSVCPTFCENAYACDLCAYRCCF